jgi:hypothetical protein
MAAAVVVGLPVCRPTRAMEDQLFRKKKPEDVFFVSKKNRTVARGVA